MRHFSGLTLPLLALVYLQAHPHLNDTVQYVTLLESLLEMLQYVEMCVDGTGSSADTWF